MDSITKAEIEEIERMKERLLNVKENMVNKKPNQIVVGEYVNTLPDHSPNNKNKVRVIHDRKFWREYAEKASQELREKMNENTRKIIENG